MDDMDTLAMARESMHCLRVMRRTSLRYPRWWAVGASYEELARRMVDSLSTDAPSGLRIRRAKAILHSYIDTVERLHESLMLIGVIDLHYKNIQSRLKNKVAEVCSIEVRMAMDEAMSRECA
jgi:hypothetical protein